MPAKKPPLIRTVSNKDIATIHDTHDFNVETVTACIHIFIDSNHVDSFVAKCTTTFIILFLFRPRIFWYSFIFLMFKYYFNVTKLGMYSHHHIGKNLNKGVSVLHLFYYFKQPNLRNILTNSYKRHLYIHIF